MLKKLAVAALAFLLSVPAFAGGVPQIPATSQYSEPSQIVGTLNALINQLNGNGAGLGGYATQPGGVVSLGTQCQNAAAGASPQICNGQRGIVLFTGITVAAPNTNQTLTITNSTITTTSVCWAGFVTAFTAATTITVGQIVPTAGSLAVSIGNDGSGTNAVTTGTLAFNCFN